VEKNKSLLMRKRLEQDIWHGMFDFFLIEKDRAITPERLMAENKEYFEKAETVKVSRKYKHILTHQTIHCRFIHIQGNPSFSLPDNELAFYSPEEVAQLPKPALISRFLNEQTGIS
jgi:A/G-specific adenine glycosylase